MIIPRGSLAKRARDKNLVHALMQLADGEHQPFAPARVVTLHEFAHEQAIQDYVNNMPPNSTPGLVGCSDEVDELLNTTYSSMKEFVIVTDDDEIMIGIDAITINDDAITRAIKLLFECSDLSAGAHYTFGDMITLR